MKFLADMGISPKTVAFLHVLGHDAVQSILSQHGEALEHGAMISVTEGQVRVRRLPLSP